MWTDVGAAQHEAERRDVMVLQAAETLYVNEKTFEWLKLLNFLSIP